MNSYIEQDTIIKYMKHEKVIISHGGVGSEYLTKMLDIRYPSIKFRNSFVHIPYPPKGPSQIIYLYGDIYNSILSQIKRHPVNPSKLHNDKNYPKVYSLQDLFSIKKEDPFGIETQIKNFMNNKPPCPILLLKYGFSENFREILVKLTNNPLFRLYKLYNRNSSLSSITEEEKQELFRIYGKLHWIIEHSPDVMIRFPNSNYQLKEEDMIYRQVISKLPGNRSKHYIEIGGYEIYNERDIQPYQYGRLRYRKKGEKEFLIQEFKDDNIFCDIKNGGVEDFRYIQYQGKVFIVMCGLDKNKKRDMYLYNINNNHFKKLKIEGYVSKQTEKNWNPFLYQNELYFIYSVDKLCILKVIDIKEGICKIIKGDPRNYNNSYPYVSSTPLILWNYPNYIGFLHTRLPYYSVPCIFNVEKMEFRKIGKRIIFKNPSTILPWRGKIVQFPYHLDIKKEKIKLSICFEDKASVIYTIDYISFCKQFSI